MKYLKKRATSAQSLIVVLCFITLFISLALLLLIRSGSAIQLSANSISTAKAIDLALSGGDIVLSDIRQEIVDGSTSSTYGSGSATYIVYHPKETGYGGLSTSVPAIAGFTPSIVDGVEKDGLANLVKISQNKTPFYSALSNPNYSNNGTSRASESNSSSPSIDGRVVSPARWNSHYLIARPAANQGLELNSTPVPNFPSPDWIVVTRSGASKAYTSADLPLLADRSGAEYAIGRIAYAIYNEGGLLDMNAAGYPSSLSPQESCQKTTLAFADLQQIGLTQKQVDQIVGWRNPYSSQLSSTDSQFGSVSFKPNSGTNWISNFAKYNYCQTDTSSSDFGKKLGFLTVNTTTLPGAGTGSLNSDQKIVSRQQLIHLIQSLGLSSDCLQYMGTFSRALEQPSYSPHPSRPRIINPSSPPPIAGATPNESNYVGNNDAAGGDDIINPSFLSIRVTTPFIRLNGQAAHSGEPLVFSRYSLHRLAMLSFDATNTSLPPGFATTASDTDPIYNRFGLKRTDSSSPWVYNHGSNYIMTLDKVADAGREPDFAELLKAAITVGALAKGAPNLTTDLSNFQYTLDTSVDFQVLQIMANLIDQQDSDSYPTSIQINSGPGGSTVLSGVEDLPYFYRYHIMSVVEELPSPLLSNADSLALDPIPPLQQKIQIKSQWDFPSGNSNASSYSYNVPPNLNSMGIPNRDSFGNLIHWTINRTKKGSLVNSGKVACMLVPSLWNPCDQNAASNSTSLRPTQFRLYAQSANPDNSATWSVGMASIPTGFIPNNIIPQSDNLSPHKAYYWPVSPAKVLTQSDTEMLFSDARGDIFREPTLLWSNNPWKSEAPAQQLQSKGSAIDINTKKPIYGVVLGRAPISFEMTLTSTPAQPAVDGTYVVQSSQVGYTSYIPVKNGGYPQLSFVLQYLDGSNKWVTYQSVYPDMHALYPPSIVANTADYPNGQYYNPFSTIQMSHSAAAIDPRTSRWGMGTEENAGTVSPGTNGGRTAGTAYLLEPDGNKYLLTNNSTAYSFFEKNDFTVCETTRPRSDKGNYVNYSVPGMAITPGKASQAKGMNLFMRLFSGNGFDAATGDNTSPYFFPGLLSQNNPVIDLKSRNNSGAAKLYFEDADGVCRRAMGAYADTSMTDSSISNLAPPSITASPNRIGLPMATASTFNNLAVATATQQSQSRPIMLNRAFRSASEMSYAFTGTPWKNIDFFTPESGYAALLDVFCVGEAPTNCMVAGKIDLNTRQNLVLQAVLSGAIRDEWYLLATPPSFALSPLTALEASVAAQRLVSFSTNATDVWRGPIGNVSELVGRYVANMTPNPLVISSGASPDWYTYNPPAPVSGQNPSVTYAGYSGLLDGSLFTNNLNSSNVVSPKIQRFRESALRPLTDCGQTRVWNLMIDVIAQVGKYPKSANTLDQFVVEGEKRLWIHVAIDRYTGEVIDRQVEVVEQ